MFVLNFFDRVPIWDAAFLFTLAAFVVDSFNIEMLHVLSGYEGRRLSSTARQDHTNEITQEVLAEPSSLLGFLCLFKS
jgi:hypothetical protein